MKTLTQIVILASACLLAGCAVEHPTYKMTQEVRKKYPDCELVEAGSVMAPQFYVRTTEGKVLLVQFDRNNETIQGEKVIFGENAK